MITSDEVLLARLQIVHSFSQFKSYLEVGKNYYHAEYYTNIGQKDEAKFPYCEQFVVTELSHLDKPEMHLSFASVPPRGEQSRTTRGSMLLAEKYMMERTDIYGVNKFDVLLKLLERLWEYVTDLDNTEGILKTLPFVNTNMRKAIKKLKRHVKENSQFGKFAMLQAGHTQWFKKVMDLRPEEEPESSSDEELSQEVAEEDVGKISVYFCKKCKWQVGGFTCRSEKMGTCGELLVLQHDATLRCPKGCGVMSAPICCRRRAMKAQVDPRYVISSSSSQAGDILWKACPVFSCEKCGFGVDGIRCFACSLFGQDIKRNGFLNASGVHMCGHVRRAVGDVTEVVSHTVASLAASASWRKTPPLYRAWLHSRVWIPTELTIRAWDLMVDCFSISLFLYLHEPFHMCVLSLLKAH